jgi:glucose-1-phosphate thymidylyltransferase
VNDPERYGVVELGPGGKAISLEEKPKVPKSHWAITGIYFYDNQVIRMAEVLRPSTRGELEITDINRQYLEQGDLKVSPLSRGVTWLDTGSFESLLSSSQFVHTIEQRTGLMVGCPEEVAFLKGYIDEKVLRSTAEKYGQNEYGRYLYQLLGK